MPAAMEALAAIRARTWGDSASVIDKKAGTASGLTLTNNAEVANKIYSSGMVFIFRTASFGRF
ncbi:MAG TPA: hypothetical protein VG347_13255 [Verrucomicrobiae bacterium]|nr:hypothetical protein [Verrucomicrobiae bacterium]